jgi:hypothetical protein
MKDIDLIEYNPHWTLGHPEPNKTKCPWCNLIKDDDEIKKETFESDNKTRNQR